MQESLIIKVEMLFESAKLCVGRAGFWIAELIVVSLLVNILAAHLDHLVTSHNAKHDSEKCEAKIVLNLYIG